MNNNTELLHIYSDGITSKCVFIIGPTPPPLGGVSVHVKRVMTKLKEQRNIVVHINPEQLYYFNFLLKRPFKYAAQLWYLTKLTCLLVYYRPEIVMYHSFCMRNMLPELMIIYLFKKIIGYTSMVIEHDPRHMCARISSWQQQFSYYLARIDHLVCIGNTTHQSYADNGISMPPITTIESSFLPPTLSEEQSICATYPPELFTFLATHNPRIIVNAFQLTLWNGSDLYGIDQAIEVIKELKKSYPEIGLVIVLSSIGDEDYYQTLTKRMQEYHLCDSVFIMHGQKELWPLLKHATLFVRPTLSDSYGISIAEALYVGTPAIASDVCKRPVGTVLYTTGDVDDLIEKAYGILKQARSLKSSPSTSPIVNHIFRSKKVKVVIQEKN